MTDIDHCTVACRNPFGDSVVVVTNTRIVTDSVKQQEKTKYDRQETVKTSSVDVLFGC